ncbi:Glycoside hydrolase, family 28 [Corchorus olitorius]|uniref:Polygalacturonase n=1 Tax=Corchorus olitorius TaxID=93759 RepID=A0A1R3KT20_9ROSI|nr:Glycoside hydrolase, family 28 [Corchorus olitorius]
MGLQWNIAVILSSLLLFTSTTKAQSNVFNVVAKYGAKADGKTDLNQPLLDAWKEACELATPSKIVIPKGTFFLSEAKLEGPCKGPIDLQVQGIVKAPADPSAFKEPSWVVFSNIEHFTMSGGGTFDGNGAAAWGKKCAQNKYCAELPINLRFNSLTNAMIQDITTKDSKQFTVNVIGCKNITFLRFTVSNPENSLNTDGIHIGRSNGVNITNSNIKTGDDCVSLGDGSQNVIVHGITCGPGHGISIGSLGKFQNEEPVSGIRISNCTLTNTQNGVRIKSWPASYPGSATDMHFENIVMNNVGNPILIDQQYCPWNQCNLKMPSKIKLSKISFKNIKGTSSNQHAVKLICSSGFPCQDVELADIDISYKGADQGPATSQCLNVKPKLSGKQNPSACSSPAPLPQTAS